MRWMNILIRLTKCDIPGRCWACLMHNRRVEITLCNYEEIVTIFLNEEKMLMKLKKKGVIDYNKNKFVLLYKAKDPARR